MIAVHVVSLLIAALAAQSDSANVRREPDRLVLFAVDAAFDWRIDPIVAFEADGWMNPTRTGGDPAAVWRAYYDTSPEVNILSRNEVVGSGTLTAAPEPVCFDMFGLLVAADTSTFESSWTGLASTDPRIGGDRLGRIASEKETETLLEHARALAGENGIADSLTSAMTPFGPILALTDSTGAAEMLAGGFRLLTWMVDPGGWERDRQIAIFLVQSSEGAVVDWFRDQHGELVSSMSVVDVVDIEGDGLRELVVRMLGYEGWNYRIYSEETGWQPVFEGGGGGC